MFERFSEKARRTIFFARYEASQWGDSEIRPEHLFLALLREDKELFRQFIPSLQSSATLWEELGLKQLGSVVPTSVDMPVSEDGKRVLGYGIEEAANLEHEQVETADLVSGLLREPSRVKDWLNAHGMSLEKIHESRAKAPEGRRLPASEQIVFELRSAFRAARAYHLTPDVEPAVVYHVRPVKAQ